MNNLTLMWFRFVSSFLLWKWWRLITFRISPKCAGWRYCTLGIEHCTIEIKSMRFIYLNWHKQVSPYTEPFDGSTEDYSQSRARTDNAPWTFTNGIMSYERYGTSGRLTEAAFVEVIPNRRAGVLPPINHRAAETRKKMKKRKNKSPLVIWTYETYYLKNTNVTTWRSTFSNELS